LIFLLTSLVIVLSERSTQEALDEIINVEEPTRAASFEMEINTVEISRDVLDYLETGDERFRERFADDREDFERSKARHSELVDTPTGVEQGEMISSVYERYVVLGADLLDASDEQDDLLDRTNRGFEAIDSIADETIEAEVDNAGGETGTAEELGRLADIQYDIAAMNTSLASYLREPGAEPRQRVLDDEAEVREGFEAYGNLDLDESERERIRTLEKRFDATTTEVNGLLDSVETLRENEREFVEAQVELDDILDEEVQPWTAQQLTEAEEAANDSIRNVYVTILVLLLVGMLVGALAAYLIARSILGSVRRLKTAVDKINAGDLEYRIEPSTNDELGSVAVAFNGMLDNRREANSALRESEERFRNLSESTFEGIVISEKGDVIESNRAFAEMFGYEPSEIVEKNTLDFTLPIYHDLIQRNSLSNYEDPYEVEGIRKDGSTFDIEIRGKSTPYLDRTVYTTAVRDITARKEVEAQLREAEARYRTVVEQIPAVTYTQEIDHDLSASFISPQIETMLGYTPEDYAANQNLWVDTVHPDDQQRVMAEDARTNETFEPFIQEYRQFARDGRIVWVRDEAVVVSDEEDKPNFWQGILSDITERKESEEELRIAEERFRSAFDDAGVGMAVNTPDGRFIEVNHALCDMLGYREEQLLTFTFRDITYPEDVRLSVDKVRDLLDGETSSFQLEKRYLHAEGHPVWISLNVAAVRDRDGKPLYLIAQTQDITESKQSKEALEESEERYRLVAQATKETIWDSDILADRQTWNGAVGEMLGISEETETDAAW
jgi:PAS domain S-box-containing protein